MTDEKVEAQPVDKSKPKAGRPPKQFTCEFRNIFTSEGKLTKGETSENLSAEEVKTLEAIQKQRIQEFLDKQ
ncbi:MAG: hypothetical protein AB2793_06330 [Candidatus Thiodiazotropha sp.]